MKRNRVSFYISLVLIAALSALCVFSVSAYREDRAMKAAAEEEELARLAAEAAAAATVFPARENMTSMGAAEGIEEWWTDDYGNRIIKVSERGFRGDVVLFVSVWADGTVEDITFDLDVFAESEDIGARILESEFLRQFIGISEPFEYGDGYDAVTGASYSSAAFRKALNRALSFDG